MSQKNFYYTDETPMPFGKYKGVKLANVPATYLIWCDGQEWCKGYLKTYIQENMTALEQEMRDQSKTK